MAAGTQPTTDAGSRLPFAFAVGLTFSSLVRLGGFSYPDTGIVAVGLLLCAVSVHRRGSAEHRALWLVAPFVAVWLYADFIRGSVDRSLALGGGIAVVAAGIVVTRRCGRGIDPDHWLLAVSATVNAVSVGGWLLRDEPLALVFDERYRLAGTVAYPNAAGLFAAVGLVLAVASRANARVRAVSVFIATSALFGSLSRGAVLAAVVGVALMWRRLGRRDVLPAVLGAGVAAAGIATSASASRQYGVLAAFGVVAILLVAVSPTESRRAQLHFAGRAVAALTLAVVLLALPRVGHVAQSRFNAASTEDRTAEWSAAYRVGMRHPLTGDGPERDLIIHNFRGYAVARYAHNEFLQVFAGAGLVGVVTFVVAIGAVGWAARDRSMVAAGTSGVAAVLLIGALIDFPWHFVALMAFGGLCLGRRAPE